MRSFAATSSLSSRSAPSGGSPARIRRARAAACSSPSNTVLLASSSRLAIASAFIATSVRNFSRWSSSVGSSSLERNSRTASISSGAVGRSPMPLDQVEELVLHLCRHPAEHRVLDTAVDAGEVPSALRQAARRPLDVAQHLPPRELGLGELAPRQLCIAREVRADLADSPQPPVVGAEPPCANHRPADVLARVGEVGELPIEEVLEAALRDDDVADPEVAVADDVGQRLRPVLAQPPEPILDRRVRLAHSVELVLEPLEHVAGAEKREPVGPNRVDLRDLLRELGLEPGRRVADDSPADRLSLDELHREGFASAELA